MQGKTTSSEQDEQLPQALQAILNVVQEDTCHGANGLALICMQKIAAVMQSGVLYSRQNWLALIEQLMACRSSMVSFANLMQELKQGLLDGSPQDFTRLAPNVVSRTCNRFHRATEQMTTHAASLIEEGATIVSISRSSSVLTAFRKAKGGGINFSVIQLASGPANEGYIMAAELNRLDIPTLVITDAQINLFTAEADLVMAGCDSWLADQYFINKVGTYPLALVAKAHSVPFWVLADRYKNSGLTREDTILEEMSPAELRAPTGKYIRVRNIYFEPVPLALINGRVDEDGCHYYDQIPGKQ